MGTLLPPPRCLEAIGASPAEAPAILLDTYTDSPNRFFSLACPCGGTLFSVSGEMVLNQLINQAVVDGPVTVRCTACHRDALVFDPRLHGYDVEIDHFPPTWNETNPPREFKCPNCSRTSFNLVARFEYPAQLIEALEAGADPGYPTNAGREEDLFTWFTLIGLCSGCQENATIASCVCA